MCYDVVFAVECSLSPHGDLVASIMLAARLNRLARLSWQLKLFSTSGICDVCVDRTVT